MTNKTNRREFMKCITCASIGIIAGGLGCGKSKKSATEEKSEETNMNELIAFCGIACHECGAFLATQTDDNAKRKEVAELWSKQFNSEIKPEDINCKGCTSEEDVRFSYCRVCEIRKCAEEKKVVNCAHCESYPCDKLSEFLKMVPEAKQKLDEIRSKLT